MRHILILVLALGASGTAGGLMWARLTSPGPVAATGIDRTPTPIEAAAPIAVVKAG